MSIFDYFRSSDINAGVEEYRATPSAVLLDVRTAQEYNEGHIHGSLNLPLQEIQDIEALVPDRDAPIFVHCLSGGRSGQACAMLCDIGYTRVKNIGGISAWRGKVEK